MAQVKTIQDEMRESHERLSAMVQKARDEDRDFTPEEQKDVDGLTATMKALDGKRKREEGFSSLLSSLAPVKPEGNGHTWGSSSAVALMPASPRPRKSLGAQFVEHEIYQQIRSAPRGGSWSSPPFELNAAATIDNFPAPPAQAFPAGLTIEPYLNKPGEWYVSALFAQGTLDGSLVTFLREKLFTNNAAVVAAGASKPESVLTFEQVNQGLSKIAHWIPVVDELLEDISGLRSYIDARMVTGVIDRLEDQVINGPGTAGTMLGLLATPGLTAPLAAAAGSALASSIAIQRANIYEASRLRPDAVVMSPSTFAVVSTQVMTGTGYLGGPALMADGAPPRLWGMRMVESPSIADGSALLGSFQQGAQLWRKGGVTVQATNSHSDLFVKNTTAIRAEIRVALTVYRPAAFGLVTGLVAA